MLVERKGGMRQPIVSSLGTERDCSALEVQVRLVGGIGVSVINSVPEELVFINLEQIEVIRNRGFAQQPCWMAGTIDFSMGKIFLSYAKYFHCSCHPAWLLCKTSIAKWCYVTFRW